MINGNPWSWYVKSYEAEYICLSLIRWKYWDWSGVS
jgi:hypothetical protein